jgi:hypothetical protein
LAQIGIKYEDAIERLDHWARWTEIERIGDTIWQGKKGGNNFQWFMEFNGALERLEPDIMKCATKWLDYYPYPLNPDEIACDDIIESIKEYNSEFFEW